MPAAGSTRHRGAVKPGAIEAGLHGGSFPKQLGGQGWTLLEQVLVHEQLGQLTGGLWGLIPGGYNAWSIAMRTSDAATSSRASAASATAATRSRKRAPDRTRGRSRRRQSATRATGDYVLNGEKWFVTGPPDTDFMIFQATSIDGTDRQPTLFLVDYDTSGVSLTHDPDYMHTFADRHPQFVLEDVRVPASAILGGVGSADDLTNEWFVEERIHIGARCTGAMERLLTEAVEWATGRVQFGDASRLPGRVVPACRFGRGCIGGSPAHARSGLAGRLGADPKVVHAKASLAKLFASEAAFRCADRVVQVFGGRGYMRETAAERFFRELRVDRIWEGTSEIQRLIIARALEKRGVDKVVG